MSKNKSKKIIPITDDFDSIISEALEYNKTHVPVIVRGKLKPFVSVICPTYNRRSFLPSLIDQFNYQTYPQEYMELIIVDDSPDSNQDIIPHQLNIKYTYLPEKIKLGKKRNMLNSLATGDIIVCFDDDDYYSPERVAHAVQTIQESKVELVGSTIIHIYYTNLQQIYQFGPYSQNHATNGTMAYTKKYTENHSYIDDKDMGEESHFTNNFSEPLAQLNPQKVMLCIAHGNNTVDKDKFIPQGKLVDLKLSKFFKINNKKMIDRILSLSKNNTLIV